MVARVRVSLEAVDLPPEIGVAVLECCLPEDETEISVLNADFFDDERVVIIYRVDADGWIGMVEYGDVEYGYVKSCSREDLMEGWNAGGVQKRRISGGRVVRQSGGGRARVAVNGRTGRGVGCVVDDTGTEMECFDLEGEMGF